MTYFFLILIFLLALLFTWSNGFQHASAVVANAVGSHAIEKRPAIVLVFIFEFLGTLFGGSAVAGVVQSLSSWPREPTLLPLLASALSSAIIWNFFARKTKMPASSTHALIGGIIGALFAGDLGFEHVQMGEFDLLHPSGVIGAVISLFLSPMLGFVFGYIIFCLGILVFMRASNEVDKRMGPAQWFLTAALAFGDGQNDTQKTMGLVVLAFEAAGISSSNEIPLWLRLVIGLTMGVGAFWINPGLVKEIGFGVFKMKNLNSCAAETASASVLIGNSLVGGPVSASQVIAASVMGAGAAERSRGIHWLVIKDILLSWLVTIPANALLAACVYFLIFKWLGLGLGSS